MILIFLSFFHDNNIFRQAKKQKNEERGNKLQNVLKNHSWNSADGAKSLDKFDKKFEESRNETVSNGDGWDDEIDLVRHEIDERQAKKERVKKNLKDKLKLLDNYGPLLDDEKEKEILVKEGVKEKNKLVKKVGDEEVEELVFVDVDVSDEEDKKKVRKIIFLLMKYVFMVCPGVNLF